MLCYSFYDETYFSFFFFPFYSSKFYLFVDKVAQAGGDAKEGGMCEIERHDVKDTTK